METSEHSEEEREGDHLSFVQQDFASTGPSDRECESTITERASTMPEFIDPEDKCFHGNIRKTKAIERLKATCIDSHLVRYSKTQGKYILAVLRKGLGEDTDNDLFEEFKIINEGNRCRIDGHDETFESVNELCSHYKNTSLGPSIQGIGASCPSPRYQTRQERQETERAQRTAHIEQNSNGCTIL